MPNWCYTTYKCVGTPKDIRQLHGVLKYISNRKTTIVQNGFGKFWLGNLVTKLGGNWEDYPCRGEIIDYSLQNKRVSDGLLKKNSPASRFIIRKKNLAVRFMLRIPLSISLTGISWTHTKNQCILTISGMHQDMSQKSSDMKWNPM